MSTTPTLLLDENGEALIVQEGESCNVVCAFIDMSGVAILKASLISLTVSLWNLNTTLRINNRKDQSVLDVNNGVVATDGALTLRLGSLDNIIAGTLSAGEIETHVLEFTWTWNDGVAVRTGKSEPLWLQVEKLVVVT